MTTRTNNEQERLSARRFGRRAEAPNRTAKAHDTGENVRPVTVTDPSIKGHHHPATGSRRPERGSRQP